MNDRQTPRDKDETSSLTGMSVAQRLVVAREQSLADAATGPHRMEYVCTVKGVDYINDSRSTFFDATLRSLAEVGKRTIWIVGATGAEASPGILAELLKEHIGAIVFFGADAESVMEGLPESIDQVFHAQELRTAVFLARELAGSGDAVLFSPACPSGNGFANYEERGYEFKRAVKDL
ncbi:MAG: cyanophycin synthetase [Flavobacteriales bacterium]